MSRRYALIGFALVACSRSGPPGDQTPGEVPPRKPPPPAVNPATFTATLASATVAGDCPDPAAPTSAGAASQQPPSPGDVDTSRRSFAPPPCAQSQMQVHFELRGAPTATIRIVGAEAFDGAGTSLGKLTPRGPQTWDAGTSTFVTWDQQLVDGVARDASYKLSAPAIQPRTGAYQLKLQVEAVLPDGTTLPSAPALMVDIAPEPHVVT